MVGKEEGKAWAKAHNSMYYMSLVKDYGCMCILAHVRRYHIQLPAYHSSWLTGFYSDGTVKNRAGLQGPFVHIASCLSTVGEKGTPKPQRMLPL